MLNKNQMTAIYAADGLILGLMYCAGLVSMMGTTGKMHSVVLALGLIFLHMVCDIFKSEGIKHGK